MVHGIPASPVMESLTGHVEDPGVVAPRWQRIAERFTEAVTAPLHRVLDGHRRRHGLGALNEAILRDLGLG